MSPSFQLTLQTLQVCHRSLSHEIPSRAQLRADPFRRTRQPLQECHRRLHRFVTFQLRCVRLICRHSQLLQSDALFQVCDNQSLVFELRAHVVEDGLHSFCCTIDPVEVAFEQLPGGLEFTFFDAVIDRFELTGRFSHVFEAVIHSQIHSKAKRKQSREFVVKLYADNIYI